MHKAEEERDDPAPPRTRDNNVLERHVEDGGRNQRLDERRKPQNGRRIIVGRADERDGVRHGERRDDRNERPHAADGIMRQSRNSR